MGFNNGAPAAPIVTPVAHFAAPDDDEYDFPNYATPLTLCSAPAVEPAAITEGAPAADTSRIAVISAGALIDRLEEKGSSLAAEDLKGPKSSEQDPSAFSGPALAERQARSLQQQRERRAMRPRVDYYPSAEAMRVIDVLRRRTAGVGASRIINRALIEWGASGIQRIIVSP
jgi:hypothetical protein